MNQYNILRKGKKLGLLILGATLLASVLLSTILKPDMAKGQASQPERRVNVPYWANGAPYPSRAIFWFGKVTPTNVYADVRLIYNDSKLNITVHIIDRRLWYAMTPSPANLTQWDSVSLYLDLDGNNRTSLNSNDYRFDAQLNWYEPRSNYQVSYSGNGSTWLSNPISYTVTTGWRGDAPNDNTDDRGWVADYTIPFSSLGLSGPPPFGTVWGLAVIVHNRDDINGPALPDTFWPEWMKPNSPSTWGQMHFGFPNNSSPIGIPEGNTTIRNGLNNVKVIDAEVGGNTTCGKDLWPDIWNNFGNANYAGYSQINIQNEWDISDFACFSKYYVTFPLDSLPKNRLILSAKLTMYEFGCPAHSKPSYIQAFIVNQDWQENTITWNNAPLALENISGTWVDPKDTWTPYQWDVSRAVAEAYAAGEPLRLALYSADGDYNSGKYFWSSNSDAGDIGRPTLNVQWGLACNSTNIICKFSFLPISIR